MLVLKGLCRSSGQEATVRTGHGTTDCFQIGKAVRQGCILSPCLLNLNAEYIMRNARLDEAQAEIRIAGRNINNLRYDLLVLSILTEKASSPNPRRISLPPSEVQRLTESSYVLAPLIHHAC